jgi:uncharacterized OB-fold protein
VNVEGQLAHPDLYAARRDTVRESNVALFAQRCDACGHVAFPRQPYGCEKCGAEERSEIELDAAGVLASFATVHLHQSKSIPAPFVIGEIELDGGPTIRITLAEANDSNLAIGARMKGLLVPAPAKEGSEAPLTPVSELRFARAER